MKLHDILKDFPGSQDGSVTETFRAGTQRELSDYLAGIVVPLGWARPAPAGSESDSAGGRETIDASPPAAGATGGRTLVERAVGLVTRRARK